MVLQIQGLKKSFASKCVLNQIDLSIHEKEIIAFVGANGAGKTTLMKCVLGFTPFEGEITVCGTPVSFGETPSNDFIGYLPDVPQFYSFYNARQYLTLCQKISRNVPDERVDEMLELVGLAGRKEKIHQYSRGMRQRLGIAQALLHKPKLLICDEPTSALDPEGREQILTILQEAKKEMAILFSTHILSEAERISDRMIVLHDHEIKFDGPLKRETNPNVYYVKSTNPLHASIIEKFELRAEGEGWILQTKAQSRKNEFLKAIVETNNAIEKFYPQTTSLEQFLKEVTGR